MKKKLLSTILVVVLSTIAFSYQAFATEQYSEQRVVEQLDAMINFDGSFEFVAFNPSSVSTSRSLSAEQTITIPVVGMSSFITFDKEKYNIADEKYDEFVNEKVEYSSSNVDVVAAYDGRILARGVGTAIVTVKYNDLVQRIQVTVENEIPKELTDQLLSANSNARSTESAQREAIVEKAGDMVTLYWMPRQDLVGWKGQIVYRANEVQVGMPYSQAYNGMRDDIGFMNELNNNSAFYNVYVNEDGVQMPKFGNDCSAFVGICWGLPYDGGGRVNTTYLYNNYSSIGAYSNLQRGDAVVKLKTEDESGHAFLCIYNFVEPPTGSSEQESYIMCCEQTPYNAITSYWTYTQLQNKGYKPISKF